MRIPERLNSTSWPTEKKKNISLFHHPFCLCINVNLHPLTPLVSVLGRDAMESKVLECGTLFIFAAFLPLCDMIEKFCQKTMIHF